MYEKPAKRGHTLSRSLLWLLLLGVFVFHLPLAQARSESPTDAAAESGDSLDDDPLRKRATRLMTTGHVREAVELLQRGIAEDDGADALRLAQRQGLLGIALDQVGAFGDAIVVQHHALALFESLHNASGVSAVTLNLGNSLSSVGDVAGARRYFKRSLDIKREHGIQRGIGAIYNNLAELAESEGDLDGALQLFQDALAAFAEEGNLINESLVRGNLARIFAKRGEHAAALEEIELAEDLARGQEYAHGVRETQIAHAEVLKERVRQEAPAPRERRALLAKAEASLQQALAYSRAQKDDVGVISALVSMSELRHLQGDPEQALELLTEVRERETEQLRKMAQTRATVLSVRYEHDRQQREIARLEVQAEKEREEKRKLVRWLWIACAVVLLCAVIVVLLLWRNFRQRFGKQQLQLDNEELKSQLRQVLDQRHRVEVFALRQRRFLRLASEDLREPLLEIRALAERSLVEDGMEGLRRNSANIAQRAADLVWVSDQMLESADTDVPDENSARRAELVDLKVVLEELLEDATPRALHRDQAMTLDSRLDAAWVRVDRVRCTMALREMIDILLYLNPGRCRLVFTLGEEDGVIRAGLDTGLARLPDWQDVALGNDSGDVTLRLALAWIQHAIEDNDGAITTERCTDNRRTEIVIRFPGAPPEA